MNQDNINNIQNAIDYLRSAKTDKNKELITYAIDYINKVINGIENEKQDIYVVELDRFNISNDNTNATETTIGINEALVYAKAAGYKRVELPEGRYAIDTSVKNDIVLSDGIKTWTHHRQGITMQSDMELILILYHLVKQLLYHQFCKEFHQNRYHLQCFLLLHL